MCRGVYIHKRDGSAIYVDNQRGLMQAMINGLWFIPPADPAFLDSIGFEQYSFDQILLNGYEPEGCLCPVDLERTALENGFKHSQERPNGEFDAFDDHYYES